MSVTQPAYTPLNITATGTNAIRTGGGLLHGVTINTTAASAVLTLYNNTAGSGSKIATINCAAGQNSLVYDATFDVGLTAVMSGGNADVTLCWAPL